MFTNLMNVLLYPSIVFFMQSSCIKVDLLSYESKTTDKRERRTTEWAEKILTGKSTLLTIFCSCLYAKT